MLKTISKGFAKYFSSFEANKTQKLFQNAEKPIIDREISKFLKTRSNADLEQLFSINTEKK